MWVALNGAVSDTCRSTDGSTGGLGVMAAAMLRQQGAMWECQHGVRSGGHDEGDGIGWIDSILETCIKNSNSKKNSKKCLYK